MLTPARQVCEFPSEKERSPKRREAAPGAITMVGIDKSSAIVGFCLVAASGPVGAQAPASRVKLCSDCVLVPSGRAGKTPAPLLVLLHGDNESASSRAAQWKAAAASRGFALLALSCPRSLGCQGSWWQWDGAPGWVDAQVEAAASATAVDPRRIWLVGWSGGATYVGMHVQHWSRLFAALMFHGGGVPQSEKFCAAPPLPALFLVGDRNPLHYLVQAQRESLERCGHELAWRLLPGADHAGERAALTDPAQLRPVLDWLEAHPRKEGR